MRLACDTGGTFTDLLVDDDGALRMFKAQTTPHDPVEGVLAALGLAADDAGLPLTDYLARADHFIHGTTSAINAIVTGRTARTALLCTAGHRDILLFREGGRADAFDYSRDYPQPLIPRALTFEVEERIGADGEILSTLDEAAAIRTIHRVAAEQVEAVAVCLLWSIVNPMHELRVGELLQQHLPGIPVSLSHRVNPTLREYRRASSTCIDASLKPLMTAYLESLADRLQAAGFGGRLLVTSSQGGMLDAARMAEQPIHSLNSGPAMAPVAGRHFAAGVAATAVIADTGGTTYDVSVVRDGHIPWTRESWIGTEHDGHITGFPAVEVRSIGAGGGSIAWIDQGGLLCVGPHSAGSTPGPACYGNGGSEPTVTDACLVLGYLDPKYFLGGGLRLDADAARHAIDERVAKPLGMTTIAAARAITTIATSNMVHAIEQVTIEQGIDPRDAVLVGGGGAAGLNSVEVARQLGCRSVLFPEVGAALSAAGALLSDLSAHYAATLPMSTDALDAEAVNDTLARLEQDCHAFAERAGGEPLGPELSFEGRYPSQVWEIEVPLPVTRIRGNEDVAALRDAFHGAHESLFATADRESPVEIVSWHARARCKVGSPGAGRLAGVMGGPTPATTRAIYADGAWRDARVARLEELAEQDELDGPALVESPFTTIVVGPGTVARRGADGHLAIAL